MLSRSKAKSLTIQVLILAAIAAAVTAMYFAARETIQAHGSSAGFDFLWRSAGWGIGFSFIPSDAGDRYWFYFLVGLVNTVVLGALSLAIATVIGLVVAVMRTSGNALAELIGTTYVEIVRNIPLLLQVVFWYKVFLSFPAPRNAISLGGFLQFSNRGTFLAGLNIDKAHGLSVLLILALLIIALLFIVLSRSLNNPKTKLLSLVATTVVGCSALVGVVYFGHAPGTPVLDLPVLKGLNFTGGIPIPPEFFACLVGISIYGSAYITEIIRAGFNSVDRGLTEAGLSLGLRPATEFFLIRLPLAIRSILPTLSNQYIWLLKATTIGIAVGFADFFMVVATSINQSGQTFEIIAIFMAAFLVLNYLLSLVLNLVNRSIALKGNLVKSGRSHTSRTHLLPLNWDELKKNYFGSVTSAGITILCGSLAVLAFVRIFDWAVVNAVWSADGAEACRAPGAGACWSVIAARWRLILFGLYPAEEQWRSALGCLSLIVVGVLTCVPAFWTTVRIAVLWLLGFGTFFFLMRGGILGLRPVLPQDWGGLALTLFIFGSVIVIGMPIAIGLALLRRSKLSLLGPATGLLIDVMRALPLLAVLYVAAVILPLALPQWLSGDKLYRVILAFALFYAAYQAEVLRSGFQALNIGQEEAGKSLGLTYRQNVFLVLLPQVFKHSMPPTINQVAITFKETSLVIIIGFFEILASGSAAFGTAEWSNAFIEVYVFIGIIYFGFIFSLSRYGAYLERRLQRS